MGGTTLMELYSVFNEVSIYLKNKKIFNSSPMRGSFSTTQETAGFSISILIPDEIMLKFWRAPHSSPNFPLIL